MNEKTKVVFAGLGIMGFPIAKRIHEAGFDLTGVDNSEAVRANALAAGIRMTESLIEAVADADVVLMMLPPVEISRLVFDEVLTHAPAASILVQLGTIGYAEAVREAEAARTKGVTYLDAPVIGGGAPAAEAGNLKILAGSDGPIPAGTEQLFRCFSARTFHMGIPGAGQMTKLVHNTLLASIATSTAEAFAVARGFGIDPDVAWDVFRSSSTNSFALEWLFAPALKDDYSGGAKVDILLKDLRLFMDALETRDPGDVVTHGRGALELYEDCHRLGHGQDDIAVVFKVLGERATAESELRA